MTDAGPRENGGLCESNIDCLMIDVGQRGHRCPPYQTEHAAQYASLLTPYRIHLTAFQTKDEQGWHGFVEKELVPIAEAFRTQRMGLSNKNVERYEDCEEAVTDYWLYANTLFKKDSMMMLSTRDSDEKDFKEYFTSCKKSAGWHGS